jgi:hypothetical protein
MPEYFEQESEPGFLERYLGGWRVVASAWAFAAMVIFAFGFVGAVIPRHDPSCGGPGDVTASATPNCRAVGDILERAEAETEAAASYGY